MAFPASALVQLAINCSRFNDGLFLPPTGCCDDVDVGIASVALVWVAVVGSLKVDVSPLKCVAFA